MRLPASQSVDDEVHVCFAELPDDATADATLAWMLDEEEREQAARYRHDSARRRFVLGRALLREIVARHVDTDPDRLKFVYGPDGKPFLEGSRGVEFNVSHSGNVVALAISCGRSVGIDVEEIRDNLDVAGLARRFFSPDEAHYITRALLPDQVPLFFRQWTAKEAWLKARGVGLTGALDAFSILPVDGRDDLELLGGVDGPWWIQHLFLHPAISCSLAVQGMRPRVIVRQRSWTGAAICS